MTLDITQFYQTFFDEADELLAEMERLLLETDVGNPDAEQMNAIFRSAHSIKGGAATFGFVALTETTHILESLLDRARTGEMTLRTDMVDLFLETKDVLSDQLNAYRASSEPDAAQAAEICAKLHRLAAEQAAGKDEAPAAAPATAPAKAVAPNTSGVPEHVTDTLTQLAGEKAAEDTAPEAPGTPHLKIVLKGVGEKDQDLLTDELGNLGKVASQVKSGDRLTLWLETDCSEDDIIAVCCFVIDMDQIEITKGTPPAEQVEETALPVAAAAVVEAAPVVEVASPAVAVANTASAAPTQSTSPAPVASPALDEQAPAAPAAGAPGQKARAAAPSGGEGSSIRVGVEKVDQLINLVGELVITQAMLAQTASVFDPVIHDRLFNGMAQFERNARDLQEAVMSIRMMPMDYVFSRFPRLVRDLASKLGKQIELITFGQATELDKSLIERITDPLTHLVRNSLDHGIETPEVRVAAGKDPVGQLILSAEHAGGNIVIEVSDDGAGLRRDKILAKALKQGMPGVTENMPDEDVWNLIFAPGFSTAEQVTDVSGRGVGMDVVKRNIQDMGGHVEITSRAGQGTTTRIVLPLTLAILDGMSVKTGSEIFILPLNFVMESLQPEAGDIYTVAGNERLVRVRGEYLPLVELHATFTVADARTDPTQGIVVIMQAEGRRFALLVDELVGQQQVVVKNLETNYRKIHGISAATILGDGSVALIVDVAALSRLARDLHRGHSNSAQHAAA
ncbi:chemotaxis protein CheA [Pararobbsia alpina]|uniref:Chemotaxis protein CheA n=1 Tax=Pararobbsia alpina TaxID=621374 RepID=A0A6S7AUN5_9BURK|nr:chemotaxis protein CheA [Pararobbsia alpina]CAB3778613.1 Chemotaxis protein CheA [Pararobbsia alpina]